MTRPERTWETTRLLAKPAVVEDAQVIFDEYASDASVAKYMTWKAHRSVDETVEFLTRCERVWIEGSAFPWSLWRKQDGAFAGLIEIRVGTSTVDLGYALARRWWRQGLMSEAVATVVAWALAQPTIYRVWATKPLPSAGATIQIITPGEIKWSDPPAGVARGTPSVEPGSSLQYAPLQGDPLKVGVPFAIRLRCADGYKVAPHWHPEDENIVVLKGTFSVGTGDRFDPARTRDIPAGGYGLVPGRMNHFAMCRGETDFFVYGIGPRLNYWVPAAPAKP